MAIQDQAMRFLPDRVSKFPEAGEKKQAYATSDVQGAWITEKKNSRTNDFTVRFLTDHFFCEKGSQFGMYQLGIFFCRV